MRKTFVLVMALAAFLLMPMDLVDARGGGRGGGARGGDRAGGGRDGGGRARDGGKRKDGKRDKARRGRQNHDGLRRDAGGDAA